MNKNIVFNLAFALLLISASAHAQSVIVCPSGGENIVPGSNFPIMWNPHKVTGNISLSLSDSEHGTSTPICSNIPASQAKFVWHVPLNLSGTKFRIKLSTDGKVKGSAQSQEFFTIGPFQKGGKRPKPTPSIVRPFVMH
jgi:hypothetical protein